MDTNDGADEEIFFFAFFIYLLIGWLDGWSRKGELVLVGIGEYHHDGCDCW